MSFESPASFPSEEIEQPQTEVASIESITDSLELPDSDLFGDLPDNTFELEGLRQALISERTYFTQPGHSDQAYLKTIEDRLKTVDSKLQRS